MKIIALEKECEGATSAGFALYSEAEARKVWQFQQDGFIREAYFRADVNCAVLVLEADSTEQAHEKLQGLPLVKHQLIRFELIPLKAYPGYQRLFKE